MSYSEYYLEHCHDAELDLQQGDVDLYAWCEGFDNLVSGEFCLVSNRPVADNITQYELDAESSEYNS